MGRPRVMDGEPSMGNWAIPMPQEYIIPQAHRITIVAIHRGVLQGIIFFLKEAIVGDRYPLGPQITDIIHEPLVGLDWRVARSRGPDGRLRPNGGIAP